MKKTILLFILLLVPAVAVSAEKTPWDQELPFKSATIEYTLSGIEEGKETLYIRQHGREMARHHKTTTTMMGMTRAKETIEFTDPDWIITFDLTEKTGVKMVNPQKYMREEYNNLSDAEKKQVLENSKSIGASMTGEAGGELEQKATKVLGYDCDKVTMMGATVYNIHKTGISLKTESNMMGMAIKIEATKINEGAVSQDVFRHPKDIVPTIDTNADMMARSMAKQTIAMLKDPEAAKNASGGKPVFQNPQQQEMSPEEQEQMQKAMEALKNIFGN